jgi:hypothetical protein
LPEHISGLTVCVDYADYLERTLPTWASTLDALLVVTSTTDMATRQLCAATNTRVLTTDVFYSFGASFNKAGAMDEGVAALAPSEWLLLFDADILPPPDWRDQLARTDLSPGYLYGPRRTDTNGRRLPDNLSEKPGFFQLLHVQDPAALDRPLFGDWHNASVYDSIFAKRWGPERWRGLPFDVMHLGEICVNWCGRGNVSGMKTMLAERRRRRSWLGERLR